MIEFKDTTKIYMKNNMQTIALDHINLKIDKGDIFGVIGFSGAGKSTLIRLINYLEQPTSGHVYINGEKLADYSPSNLRHLRKDIGMIFQHFNLLESKSIFQNVAMPLILTKMPKNKIRERVLELLSFVGLENKEKSYPNELSGGQKQRVGIARALATNPSILLCDEATSALDPQTTDSILDLLEKINKAYKITIVIITHEMSVIHKICQNVAVMEAGKIIEQGEVTDVFSQPQHDTTQNFVGTVFNKQIPDKVFKRINEARQSRFIEVHFNEKVNDRMNAWIFKYQLKVEIVHAAVHEIKENTVGTLILQLSGKRAMVAKAIEEAASTNILIKELHAR